jgi:hypothetical protein
VLLVLGMECVSCHCPCHSEGASRASDRLTLGNKGGRDYVLLALGMECVSCHYI